MVKISTLTQNALATSAKVSAISATSKNVRPTAISLATRNCPNSSTIATAAAQPMPTRACSCASAVAARASATSLTTCARARRATTSAESVGQNRSSDTAAIAVRP